MHAPALRDPLLLLRVLRLLPLAAMLVLAQAACTYTQKISDGATAHELRRYSEAVPLLTKEYGRTKSRVEQGQLAFKLGESYENLHRPADALEWYRRAYDYQYGPEALERYAAMLMQAERYADAQNAYKELGLEIGSRYQYRRQMQAAQMALEFDAAAARYAVAESPLNDAGSTYAPVYAGADALIVSSDRASLLPKEDPYGWTGRAFSDLYLQPLDGGAAEPLDDRINGDYNEGAAAVSPDGRHLVFTRCAPFGYETGYCQLYMSDREGDAWTEPQPLSFQEAEVNYMQPAWSADGALLYYASDHPDGIGGYDLYAVERMPQREWSDPQRLPRTINTPLNEHFPSLRGDTLFFSSDGHAGFGGLDIFRVYPIGSDTWSTPYNLRPPLNGGGDDLGIAFAPASARGAPSSGYFSSNRGDGLDRLFTFEMLPPPPPPPAPPVADTAAADEPALALPTWTLDVYVVEAIRADPTNPASARLGVKPLESAALQLEPARLADELEPVEAGHWRLTLADSLDYRFLAAASGYINRDAAFSTRRMRRVAGERGQDFELEIELDRIYAGREIVLDDIYYDFDAADIRSDAEPTLRKLARDLQLNPELRIRLGSHTDCRGGDGYNRSLSQRRAESAVAFLVAQGIDASRLEAVGYGEDVARTDCACSRCTDEEHQLNRRTTFAILE